jgi:hypothetical protein
MKNLLSLAALALLAWRMADVFGDLNITQQQAQEYVANNLFGGYFGFPPTCRKIASGQREAVVKTVGAFARAYVKTDDFKRRYAAWRDEHKPTPQTKTWEQVQQEQKEQIAQMKKSLAETKGNLKTMTPDLRKAMEPTIAQQEQLVKDMESGKSPLLMNKAQFEEMNAVMKQGDAQALAEWEQKYPISSDGLLRERLTQFLAVSEGVDYSAKTAPDKWGKQRFVNPAYEQKDGNWKQCYRAGKPAVEAARALAKDWLASL